MIIWMFDIMKIKYLTIVMSLIFFTSIVSFPVIANNNNPPNPPIINGPTSGKIGESYTYEITLTDPDLDDQMLFLEIDFGDGLVHEDCGCGKSWQNGTVLIITHTWNKVGNYDISARVQDGAGAWSTWSEPHPVNMIKSRSILKIFEKISNPIDFLVKYIDIFSMIFDLN